MSVTCTGIVMAVNAAERALEAGKLYDAQLYADNAFRMARAAAGRPWVSDLLVDIATVRDGIRKAQSWF